MPICDVDGEVVWLEEAQAKPSNNRLWNKAKQVARLDKDYNPYTAKILSRRIYTMLGGQFAPKRVGKDKGKARKIRASKPAKATKSTAKGKRK